MQRRLALRKTIGFVLRQALVLLIFAPVAGARSAATANVYVVTNTNNDNSAGSFPTAIASCAASGGGTIDFDIPGTGPFVIDLGQTPQTVPANTLVDGTSQPGYSGSPIVEITSKYMPATADFSLGGGTLITQGNVTLTGLSICNYADGTNNGGSGDGQEQDGVYVGGNADTISYCWIGVNADGTPQEAHPNYSRGLKVVSATGTLIKNNVISGWGASSSPTTDISAGIYLFKSTNTTIQSNYIGLDPLGKSAILNQFGIWAGGCTNLQIGTVGAGNVISGNTEGFSDYTNRSNTSPRYANTNLTFEANLVGLAADEQTVVANQAGLHVELSSGAIGGTHVEDRNYICGNEEGILILPNYDSIDYPTFAIEDNYIGVTPKGMVAGNQWGIFNEGDAGPPLIITADALGNQVISGNSVCGIYLFCGDGISPATTISNNYIGAGPPGSSIPMGNGGPGISMDNGNAGFIQWGGSYTSPYVNVVTGNVISANSGPGILVNCEHNSIFGNTIGIEPGTHPNEAGNTGDGIHILGVAGDDFDFWGTSNTLSQNSIFGNGGLAIDIDTNIAVPFPPTLAAAVLDGSGKCTITCSYNGSSQGSAYFFGNAAFSTELFDLAGANNPSTGMTYLTSYTGQPGTYTMSASSGVYVGDQIAGTITAPISTFQNAYQISGATSELSNAPNQPGAITVTPDVQSVQLNSNSLTGSASTGGTVTLLQTTPVNTVINLQSDSASASVPNSVTVNAGQSSATFSVTASPVATQTNCNITAQESGSPNQFSTALTLIPIQVSAISAPSTVVGGNACNGTVTINGAAGAGGASVTVVTGNAVVTVSSQPSIGQGATSGQFTLSTSAVSANTAVTVAAKLNGSYKARTIEVLAPTVSTLALVPNQVVGGTTSTGTVTLNANAAASGAVVHLASAKPSVASVQTSVTVPSQQNSATFTISTNAVAADTMVNILASANGSTQVQALTVKGPRVQAVQLSPDPIVGGNSCTGTLTLTSAAPSAGITVSLYTGNSTIAPVPATVSVTGGSTTAPFTINTNPVATDLNVNILARLNGSSATQVLKVTGPKIIGFQLSPNPVIGGNQWTGTITLSSAAPASGMTINLYSGNSTIAPVPATVAVVGGSNTASFTTNANSTQATVIVTILAKANGSSQAQSLRVYKS